MSGRHVVIPALAGIGNSLLAVPMVRRLKRAWPDAAITVLARNEAIGEPLRRLKEVDEVLITGAGIKGLLRCLKWTWPRKPDLYLVPFPSNRWQYGLLAITSLAKRKILHSFPIGYWRAMGFVGQRIPAKRGIHDVEQNLRLLSLLDIETNPIEAPIFQLTESERNRACELLKSTGISDGAKFIAVHAGSATTVLAQSKRWPAAKYAKLIELLKSEWPEEIVLLEGPDEAGVAKEITDRGAKARVLKLDGPLGEAGAVLERASLYVGSDSGLAHLAGAVGRRAVTLFAPSDPDRVSPFGNRDLVVQTPRSCSPCFMYPYQKPYPCVQCRQPYCINEITEAMVLEAIRRALVPSPSGRGLG